MDSKRSIKALILAHLDGELTGEDLKKLTDWLADSRENVRYYAQIKDLWEASLTDASRIAETEKEWAKLIQKIKKEVRHNMFRHHTNLQIIWRFAAILIVGIVMGVLVVKYTSERPPLYITAVAPKGSVTQMILADSTVVYLNAGTEIRYSPESEQKKREVFLNGEAWFDVSKQKNSPFVVHTSLYDINVTGTQFNVKSYDSDPEITTTLEEGEIRINATEKFQLAEAIILKPGEQAALDKNTKQINIKQVDTKLFTSWKDNKLIFLNMNFKELIVLLERKYGVEIEINNQGILKYHYTGTIKNESILEILEIIKHTLPIQYKIEGQKIIINKMKQEK
jgi:ferric-dicitrate binding protein FerR (iron transport regulator)